MHTLAPNNDSELKSEKRAREVNNLPHVTRPGRDRRGPGNRWRPLTLSPLTSASSAGGTWGGGARPKDTLPSLPTPFPFSSSLPPSSLPLSVSCDYFVYRIPSVLSHYLLFFNGHRDLTLRRGLINTVFIVLLALYPVPSQYLNLIFSLILSLSFSW